MLEEEVKTCCATKPKHRSSLHLKNRNHDSTTIKIIIGTGCFVTLVGLSSIVLYPFAPVDLLMRIHDAVTGNSTKRLFVSGTDIEYLVASPELIGALDSLLIIPLGMTATGLAMAFMGFWLRRRFERADGRLDIRNALAIHRSPIAIGQERSSADTSKHAQDSTVSD